MGIKAIARHLGIARNTVKFALGSTEPPAYRRPSPGSVLDAVEADICRRIYSANLRNHILPDLGCIELGKLTPSMLRAWLSALTTKIGGHGKRLAPGSVAQAYRTLNRVLTAAVDDYLLGRNPLRGVKPPRVEPKPMRFLSHEDVATLACHVDPRYRVFVLVAAYTGLRAGELMALRRKHIDLLHQTITIDEQVQYIGGRHLVPPPKSAAGRRSVAVPAVVVSELEKHLGLYAEPGAEGLVFAAPEGGRERGTLTSVQGMKDPSSVGSLATTKRGERHEGQEPSRGSADSPAGSSRDRLVGLACPFTPHPF
jgi:integrase